MNRPKMCVPSSFRTAPRSCQVELSQTRTTPPAAAEASSAVMNDLPSGENRASACAFPVGESGRVFFRIAIWTPGDQSLTVRSYPDVTRAVVAGLNARAVTPS